jgi:SAM-dependent methyltransferase
MKEKLTGQAYIDHWKNRIKKSPLEAGTPENAVDTWSFIKPNVQFKEKIGAVLEYGCAYGRMLRHLQAEWPKAQLFGVDLCKEALDHLAANWNGTKPTLFNQGFPPIHVRADLIFTCTVIQHITDDDILHQVAAGFDVILNPGGRLVLFENVTYADGGGGAHMREYSAENYMSLWPSLQWKNCGVYMHGKEAHALMIGRKESR